MKRALFFIIILIVYTLSLAPFSEVHAQTWKFQSPSDFGGSIQGEDNNAQSTWFTGLQNMSFGISCMGVGTPCSDNPNQSSMYYKRSVVGFLSNTVALTFTTPPAHFGTWLADTGQSLGFIPKQAYAQGIGFSGLLPLLPVWKVFRNVAYLLMAGVMVIIGFMVMLRKKIDPKTVVTAQNAIPRIIIALILITFSYAIVGLVIDLMYVTIALLAALFQSAGLNNASTNMASGHLTQTMWEAFLNFNPLKMLFGVQVASWIPGTLSGLIGAAGIVLGIIVNPAFFLMSLMPLIYVIYAVAIIFLWIKLLVFFISAYIQILLALLIGPLQLLAEGFPGSTAFSSWFKNLVANVAVFPVAAAMFMLSSLFTQYSNVSSPQSIWAPPYVGVSTNPIAVESIISVALLFAIVPVCGSIKEALKSKPMMPFDLGGAGGSAMGALSTFYYLKALAPSGLTNKIFGGGKGEGDGGQGGEQKQHA